MSMSRDGILSTGIPTKVVDVPEWDGKVTLRGLRADERDAYENSLLEIGPDGEYRTSRNLRNVRASLVVRCLVDEQGERLFTDEDAELLGAKDARVIDKLWQEARTLSGMAGVEELVKGFEVAQDGSSASE